MLTTTDIKIQYSPSTPTSGFSFPITYFDEEDINMEVVDSEGNITVLELNGLSSGFTVIPLNNDPKNGATIYTTETYTSGSTLTIYREVEATQLVEFQRGGSLPPQVLNTALDRNVAISQQVMDASNRSIQCPITDVEGLNYETPTVEERANKALGFDGSGNVTALDLSESGTVSVNTNTGLTLSSNIISCNVDNSTIVFNGNKKFSVGVIGSSNIQPKSISTGQLTDKSVSFEILDEMLPYTVIGNMTGSILSPTEVSVKNETNMASNSATALATQYSIKSYVDGKYYVGSTSVETSAQQTTTSRILTDIAPTISDGIEIVSVGYAVDASSNILNIEFTGNINHSSAGSLMWWGIFADSTLIDAGYWAQSSNGNMPLSVYTQYKPGTVSSKTYSFRTGIFISSGTLYSNRLGATVYTLGGNVNSKMILTEIKA